ncbi:conjugal transfer protein [Pantoea ananatis 15320]|uniref:DotH/IcmK family type IV secretion protein n=1 Tax=Pantoea ananas TaxID=553 RepID=UPI00040612E0|nr:DotH/IcmK family type IV secretion protein [Pantoea ananatis]PKC36284.1 conjugal transfer protein [Pantoea ananatis 15320]
MKQVRTLLLWCALSGSAAAAPTTDWQTAPPAGGQSGTPATTAQSTATPAQSGPQPGQALPPPVSMSYEQAEAATAPLSADEIRQLRMMQSEQEQAMATKGITAVPRISALTVSLEPGASLPLVRNAVNWPATVSFIDSTGAPWKIMGAPQSGSPDIVVKWVPGTSIMMLVAKHDFVSTSVTVVLDGLSVPVQLSVTSGETDTAKKTWVVDTRIDLRIPRRGPGAAPDAPPPSRIGLHDSTLQAFLDGVPPEGAHRLKTTGDVPDTAVWQQGDDLYIRSRASMRDEFDSTLSSADGTHLWKLPVTPRVAFSVGGRTETLSIALE